MLGAQEEFEFTEVTLERSGSTAHIRELIADGWELVLTDHNVAFFRRSKHLEK